MTINDSIIEEPESDFGSSVDLSEKDREEEERYQEQAEDDPLFNIEGFIIQATDQNGKDVAINLKKPKNGKPDHLMFYEEVQVAAKTSYTRPRPQ